MTEKLGRYLDFLSLWKHHSRNIYLDSIELPISVYIMNKIFIESIAKEEKSLDEKPLKLALKPIVNSKTLMKDDLSDLEYAPIKLSKILNEPLARTPLESIILTKQ